MMYYFEYLYVPEGDESSYVRTEESLPVEFSGDNAALLEYEKLKKSPAEKLQQEARDKRFPATLLSGIFRIDQERKVTELTPK